jgi:hypothetical protein
MSLRRGLKSLAKRAAPLLKQAAPQALRAIPGVGPIASTALTLRRAPRPTAPTVAETVSSMSLVPLTQGAVRLGRAAGRVAGPVATGVAIAGAAGSLMGGGGGTRRRRRRKGITGTELANFERVTKMLNKFCKTPPPMRRRKTGGRSCR